MSQGTTHSVVARHLMVPPAVALVEARLVLAMGPQDPSQAVASLRVASLKVGILYDSAIGERIQAMSTTDIYQWKKPKSSLR